MFRDDTPVEKFLREHEFNFAAERADEDSELAEAVRDVAKRVESHEDLKPDTEEVVKAASEEFTANVGGVANPDPIVENADPNHDIANLDELLQYHFLRTGRRVDSGSRAAAPAIDEAAAAATTHLDTHVGVRDFVDLLEDRLRTVDTDAAHEVQQFDGEIRGRVDWQETIKHWYSTGEPAGQTYACRVQRRDTLSARNRVLFDFLGELVGLCEQFDRNHVGSDGSFPTWLAEWDTGGELRNAVESGLSNAHFSRVDTSEVTADHRAIRTVRRDREPLYREAAALLERLRTIQREGATDDDAEDLFGIDVFEPKGSEDSKSTIYELYWHFRIAAQFEASELRSIDLTDEENDLVAAWEDKQEDLRYLQFNDWDGSAAVDGSESVEYLNFAPPNASENDGPERGASRAGEVYQAWWQVRDTALEKSFNTGKGTPDIVLLELDTDADQPTIERLFIGEVKRTDSLHTIDEGIAQLAEYGAFAEVGDDAVLADDPDADYVARETEFLSADRLELGLFISSGHQVKQEADEIQLCWFDGPDESDGTVDRPFLD